MTFDTLIKSAPPNVLDRLEKLKSFRERPDFHPEESCYEHIKIVTNRLIKTGNINLIIAGIFHDIMKLDTAKTNPKNGYPTSPGHDTEAAFLIRMNFANRSKSYVSAFESWGADHEKVALICEQHMRIKQYSEMNIKKQRAYRKMEIFSDLLIFAAADDMLTEFVYPYNQYFPTQAHRNIWIRLNADNQIIWEKNLKYLNNKTGKYELTNQALNPRSLISAIEIAENQLNFDEKNGALRYSIEELFLLDYDALEHIRGVRHIEFCKKSGL